jgi:subtilase family serine protease
MNRKIASVLALALLAAGCGGNGAGSTVPSAVNPQLAGGARAASVASVAAVQPAGTPVRLKPFAGAPALANFEWGKALLEQMTYVGPAAKGALAVDVLVRMRDPEGLAQYALSTGDPKSANYRRFLTPLQIADRFGASDADYRTVANYFAKTGMRVGMWPQREVLSVTGTLDQFTRAFGTSFATYTNGKQTLIGPAGIPHFTTVLPVSAVMHLQTFDGRRTYNIRGNYGNFAGYTPQMIASGFDYSGAYQAGYTGQGIVAAVNGTGPISSNDLALYSSLFHATVANVIQVNASPQPPSAANGHTGSGGDGSDPYPAGLTSPPPTTALCTQPAFPTPPNYHKCNGEDYEAQLDSQQVAALAPGATELFYMAYNPMICVNTSTGEFAKNNKNGSCPKGSEAYPLIGIQLADDSLQQSIADNRADTMSLSWGAAENEELAAGYINSKLTGFGNIEFASLAAEGISVFVSTGDDGAWECFDPRTGAPLGIACLSYPASDPNVTGVGAVNAPLDESGRLNGEITAWADNLSAGGDGHFQYNNVGSGGGISMVFKAPAYQSDAVKGIKMRELPDMSLDGAPASGPAIVVNAKWAAIVGAEAGTSVAAPEANAQWAVVLSACKATPACATAGGSHPYRLGNAAPLLYQIYSGKAILPYAQTVYDVIYGNNQAVPVSPPPSPKPFPTPIGYSAGPGYDMVTGIGVPFTGHLINALVKVPTAVP